MIDWFEKRLLKISYAFSEFPKLKWLSIFYFSLIIIVISMYQPFIIGLYKFNIMGMYVFQETIKENVIFLIWGQFILPLILTIICYLDVVSEYEEKHIKRYGQLPKWIN
ncbi:hypothetical protein GWP85_07120 [Acinetobacter beijerinckii]|uniref:hypothetical protein n=1 Tax=Acinetobacter beijerinckii TaxID=262668 RepID=UPI0023DDB269|nr:hypothetical protein [Acinetobacter beijerinckii]MDF2417289.1 hypothetical protein [Acinetobacter beijerinckii]